MEIQNINLQTQWIETLAIEEMNMEESGVIHFHDHLNTQKLLEESSIEIMEQLKELFEVFTARFNEFRTNPTDRSKAIKIFKISNTVNDFMLFRNSLKLVIARRSSDAISIGFISNTSGAFGARLSLNDQGPQAIQEIRAQVGAFNKITWNFQGDKIDPVALVKHYLSEFIRYSAR
jgi:hypothetical protein